MNELSYTAAAFTILSSSVAQRKKGIGNGQRTRDRVRAVTAARALSFTAAASRLLVEEGKGTKKEPVISCLSSLVC